MLGFHQTSIHPSENWLAFGHQVGIVGQFVQKWMEKTSSKESLQGTRKVYLPSLKLTAKAPENGWLEYDCFLLGPTIHFQGRGVCCKFQGGPYTPGNSSW